MPLQLRPRESSPPSSTHHNGIGGGWIFLIVLLLLALLALAAYVIYTRLRARRLGLPPPSLNPFGAGARSTTPNYPSPAPGGLRGWLDAKYRAFKNRRVAAGAYEEPSGGYGGRNGRRGGGGALDPDEAWDSHVGNEAYYEEQELGLHAPSSTAYGGGGYGAPSPGFAPQQGAGNERGRSRTRELDSRYDEDMHGGGGGGHERNPFGDDAATISSLRGVSPRPVSESERAGEGGGGYGGGHAHKGSAGSLENSPTERRSMFRENM
ncbi:hypothetical protein K432DRAFT_312288 [Lepidopterella palustris CBS 459.81]|uniref:Acid phosphatase-like protein n=1 Tax=Lepidopterella palustris CBS 459.81 TaxID=1314670 RepID=A0A8E2J8W6_9PEZI|nr:hypothetical protein K432DRAFT_312288 [Lepidopterella palustris CBS 459.81]